MRNPWLWKILLVPAFLILVFGIIGMLFPDADMGFYLTHTAQTTVKELTASQPQVALLLQILFRADGVVKRDVPDEDIPQGVPEQTQQR